MYYKCDCSCLVFLFGGSANGKREKRRRRGGRERREGEEGRGRREGEEGGRGGRERREGEEKKGKEGEKGRTKVIQLMYMHSHMRPLNLHGMAV